MVALSAPSKKECLHNSGLFSSRSYRGSSTLNSYGDSSFSYWQWIQNIILLCIYWYWLAESQNQNKIYSVKHYRKDKEMPSVLDIRSFDPLQFIQTWIQKWWRFWGWRGVPVLQNNWRRVLIIHTLDAERRIGIQYNTLLSERHNEAEPRRFVTPVECSI